MKHRKETKKQSHTRDKHPKKSSECSNLTQGKKKAHQSTK